jgi:hypothetical protein
MEGPSHWATHWDVQALNLLYNYWETLKDLISDTGWFQLALAGVRVSPVLLKGYKYLQQYCKYLNIA